MSLKLYNTLTKQKEIFQPQNPDEVTFYLCGPTVYDLPHLGNARSAICADVLYRVLSYLYENVKFARNFTDFEDKIINAAQQNNESISDLTKRTEQAYLEDMDEVNVLLPDLMPRATEHISDMIKLIGKLIKNNHAYVAEGHVLFDVPSMPNYGSLSKQNRDDMIAGARVEVAPYKKDPADFVLWKPSTPEQPGWDSPWGRGRPGWHIECTAMIHALFGPSIDIHAGGQDLIFPHHENEIAQAECVDHKHSYVRYWVHNGMLIVNGEKMSKSVGNFLTVRELLDKVPGEAIRFYMLGTHYRQSFDFTMDGLEQAKLTLDRFYLALRDNDDIDEDEDVELQQEFMDAMEDDVNTPLILTLMHQYLTNLNKAKTEEARVKYKSLLSIAGQILGILEYDPESWFKWGMDVSEEEIEAKIEERQEARDAKDYAKADEIRKWFTDHKIEIEDSPQGTKWRQK